MHYENRQPPEGINVVKQGWARDFFLLILGFFAGLALLCWLLLQLVAWSARWMPFSWEQALTRQWQAPAELTIRQEYLQHLADSLARAGGLSPDLHITLRTMDSTSINAFATLGGNVIVMDGLIEALASEQGLAFVIAHEIAHVQHRHPIQAVARGLGLGVFFAVVFGQTDFAQVVGLGGELALLNYSREQERQADSWALNAVNTYYGNVAGADELFRHLKQEEKKNNADLPEWLSSHPDVTARLSQLNQLADKKNYSSAGELVPLPITSTSVPDNLAKEPAGTEPSTSANDQKSF